MKTLFTTLILMGCMNLYAGTCRIERVLETGGVYFNNSFGEKNIDDITLEECLKEASLFLQEEKALNAIKTGEVPSQKPLWGFREVEIFYKYYGQTDYSGKMTLALD
jgi:hypothetical protein